MSAEELEEFQSLRAEEFGCGLAHAQHLLQSVSFAATEATTAGPSALMEMD